MKALRPKELELMSVFWGTDTPLATAEVKALATEYSWGKSSLSVMIVGLVKLGFLEIAGNFQKKNIICNTYRAAITKDRYFSELISEIVGQASPEFVLGFLSNLKNSRELSQETIGQIQQLLASWTD